MLMLLMMLLMLLMLIMWVQIMIVFDKEGGTVTMISNTLPSPD